MSDVRPLVQRVLNVLLALFFGGVAIGALLDGRMAAVPLGLIFAALAAHSLWKAFGRQPIQSARDSKR